MRTIGRSSDWLLLVTSLLGLMAATIAFFWSQSGVSGSIGALIVCCAAAALAVAALIYIAAPGMPRWLWRTLEVLVLLGALLTAFASYLLMQTWLTVAMALAVVFAAGHFFRGHRSA